MGFAYLGTLIDHGLGLSPLRFPLEVVVAVLLLTAGFLLRVWAAAHFYAHRMRVIVLHPQHDLITSGPFRFSRNPLYLGGNVFIFLGASLLLGSPAALLMTLAQLGLVDRMIRREERQLERDFGERWLHYRREVRRWL